MRTTKLQALGAAAALCAGLAYAGDTMPAPEGGGSSMMPALEGAGSSMMPAAEAAGSSTLPARQNQPSPYRLTLLASLGGANSRGSGVNNGQWVTGYSTLAGEQARHAVLWLYGTAIDLGTLGGANSSINWPVKNNVGLIAGISQTSTPDPLGERWSCAAFFGGPNATGNTCVGFAWKWGALRALPTLGGNNGFAAGANNREEIFGWAENAVHDPTCVAPQVLQFRGVIWGPGKRHIRELAPLPGDSSSAATAINDQGQAVGISGLCDQAVGRHTAKHAVLWERNGNVKDLGNLGGTSWNTPMAINQRGDVVGFAGEPGDDDGNVLHAFLWTRHDGMQALGTLPGHVSSEAHAINERGQIVGTSCDAAGACRAVLWQNGAVFDLNSLVASGATATLTTAQDINDLGEITGRAVIGTIRQAFLASPTSH